MNFCPRCGKDAKLVGGLCPDCLTKTIDFATIKNRFVKCPVCKRWLSKGVWKDFESAAKDAIKTKGRLIGFYIFEESSKDSSNRKPVVSYSDNTGNFTMEYSVDYMGHVFGGTIKTKPIIQSKLCDNCSKGRGGYYEAVIQLRGDWARAFEHSQWVATSKIDMRKEGPDLYVIKFSEANKLAAFLKKKFRPEFKESSSQAGMKEGKHISRKTIMLRFGKLRSGLRAE